MTPLTLPKGFHVVGARPRAPSPEPRAPSPEPRAPSPEHAATAVRFALRAQEAAAKVLRPDLEDGPVLQMRARGRERGTGRGRVRAKRSKSTEAASAQRPVHGQNAPARCGQAECAVGRAGNRSSRSWGGEVSTIRLGHSFDENSKAEWMGHNRPMQMSHARFPWSNSLCPSSW